MEIEYIAPNSNKLILQKICEIPDKSNDPNHIGQYYDGVNASRCAYQIPKVNTYAVGMKTKIYRNRILVCVEWDSYGKLHRFDGPACITYRKNGTVKKEAWYTYGLLNKSDGPAITAWDNKGAIKSTIWYAHHNFHRIGGPAVETYSKKGTKLTAQWYWRGKLTEDWIVLAQAALPAIHAGLPQPIAEEIADQFTI